MAFQETWRDFFCSVSLLLSRFDHAGVGSTAYTATSRYITLILQIRMKKILLFSNFQKLR